MPVRFKPFVIGVGGGASRGGVLSLSVLLACKYQANSWSAKKGLFNRRMREGDKGK